MYIWSPGPSRYLSFNLIALQQATQRKRAEPQGHLVALFQRKNNRAEASNQAQETMSRMSTDLKVRMPLAKLSMFLPGSRVSFAGVEGRPPSQFIPSNRVDSSRDPVERCNVCFCRNACNLRLRPCTPLLDAMTKKRGRERSSTCHAHPSPSPDFICLPRSK